MLLSGEIAVDLVSDTDDGARDATLVSRALDGDEAAWLALVRCHQEPVFRLAYLMLGKEQDPEAAAQDVAQETFIRAFQKMDQFDRTRPLRPWLLAITANLARNRRRSLGRYWAALRRWWQANREEHEEAWSRQESRDDSRLLWQAIQQLPEDHRQALYLRYFLDMPEAEMALALEVAAGTVKSRLYRARKALGEILEEQYPVLYGEWRSE